MFHLRQWINWRIEPDPAGGKPDKVPFNLVAGHRINPQDPSQWLTFNEAAQRDPRHIGFVLTRMDPYFCVDLDAAWNGAEWSPLATDILARFPGAFVEVSYSGDGLHIFGQGAVPDQYGTRGTSGVECYTHDRFIAYTGTHAHGDPNTPHDLTGFAALYLKVREFDDAQIGWTTTPVPEHTPIEDDETLIKKMLAARQGAGVAFGGKASPADLWTGNVPALAAAWPSQTDDFGRSEADAALAAHLAFWTGKDCERTLRLMKLSGLVRPKWDRDDYLKRTIAGAAQRVSKVYTGGSHTANVPDGAQPRAGWQYLDITQQTVYFAGCVHIVKGRRILTPRGILKPEEFRDHYSKYEFQIDPNGGRPSKDAYEAFVRNRAITFPWADTTCFRPELEPAALVEENGRVLVNTYQPANVVLGSGPVDRWNDLITRMLPDPNDREILMAYLAAVVQYPGVKFQWCPLIQGVEGNGKSAILRCMEYAVSPLYTHKPNAKELGDSGSKFTGWLLNKLLILVEEIHVGDRRETLDALKPLITDARVEIQQKGADQITGDNRANFILTSNHRDAILKTENDRRYAVFYTAQQDHSDIVKDGMSGSYMSDLYQWLNHGGYADVAGHLVRYQIPEALNPATVCHRAPRTSSTDAAIAESRGVVEQEILQAVLDDRPGFRGGWISSVAVSRLLIEIKRTVAPRKRGKLMESLGFIPHPALTNGQATTAIMQEDMKRPVLYAKTGSILMNFEDGNAATQHYMQSQGYAGVVTGVAATPGS